MNADIFAEWLSRQGYKVIRTRSSYWYEASVHVYQAFPYHWTITPAPPELLVLFRDHLALALRYSTPLDQPEGCISYHVIYDRQDYSLACLDRRSRQNINKGLKNCTVAPLPFDRLAREGWLLESDTHLRQARYVADLHAKWHGKCSALADLPGFEAWGAFVGGRLAASLLTFTMGDCCEMIFQHCHRDYLKDRVNNALTFEVTRTMITRPNIRTIFYALHSLDAPESVDEFKFRMGFYAKPVRQRVLFNPIVAPLANGLLHQIFILLLRRKAGSNFLAKAEGMLRFYQQGKRTLSHQQWPRCLDAGQNDTLPHHRRRRR
ncbi:MAG: hypothetical protein VR64_06885 [Desulfatitalea sp. BRH_c12]|nr:MAG: hypothetical protein VR64_06885 [Desulfatitalea sp. BRH_c12]